jgi:hypothetical protein
MDPQCRGSSRLNRRIVKSSRGSETSIMSSIRVTRCRINGRDFRVDLEAEINADMKVDVFVPAQYGLGIYILAGILILGVGILIGALAS